MERVRVIYQGRVQGVGFRWACMSAAGPFAVTGLVRNQSDGTVLLEAQGESAEVQAFLASIRQRMAQNIQHASAQPLPTRGDERAFEILR